MGAYSGALNQKSLGEGGAEPSAAASDEDVFFCEFAYWIHGVSVFFRMSFSDELVERLSRLDACARRRELKVESGPSWSHNDYLGLASHPSLLRASAQNTSYAGSRGSRLLGGHSGAFESLEAEIAEFFGAPDSLFFSSGYLANVAVAQAMGQVADGVISDANLHASSIDGVCTSRREKEVLPHNQWQKGLEAVKRRGWKRVLVLAESLYSMDGDFCDEKALRAFCDQTDSFLAFDEAHSAGIFLEDGTGCSAPWRNWDRTAVTVTFGKAFGATGAAVLCSPLVKSWLVNSSRSFIYTTASPACVLNLVQRSLRVMRKEGFERRRRLKALARSVREVCVQLGAPIRMPESELEWQSPILPFLLPGEDNALRFAQSVRETGLAVKPIRYPTVPVGAERIRVSLNLGMDEAESLKRMRKMVELWQEFSSQEQIQTLEKPR